MPNYSLLETVDEIDKYWMEASQKSLMSVGLPTDIERDAFTRAYSSLGGVDLAARRVAMGKFAELRTIFEGRLTNLATGVESGTILVRDALKQFKELGNDFYQQAFRLGGMHAGNPFYADIGLTEIDRQFADIARATEQKYLGTALRQIQKGESPLSADMRATGFAKGLDAQFWNGYPAGGGGDGMQVHWQLGHPISDHCPDCLDLNARSPYTKETLPTVPRAGDTACLTACYCELIWVTQGQDATGGLTSVYPGEVTGFEGDPVIIRSALGVPISGGISELFNNLFTQMYVLRAKMALTAGEEQALLAAQRKLVNAEIIKLQDAYGVKAVPRYSVKDIIKKAQSLQAKGLDIVKETWLCPGVLGETTITEQYELRGPCLRLGMEIWEVAGINTRVGIVTKVDSTGVTMQRANGVVKRLPWASVLFAPKTNT